MAVVGYQVRCWESSGDRYLVALEGKGPRDPLNRPFAGRRMSAVDQAYRYAINLPCDWIVVTSVRETRLYYKGADQHTFGWNRRRLRLLKRLEATPGDYDVAWEPTNVDIALLLRLDPVFGDFTEERAAQKAKYGGEFFPSSVNEALSGRTFLDFFQTDKETGAAKGIVAIRLGENA